MVTARCCPADCALREDWQEELNLEKAALNDEYVIRLEKILRLISHPVRLKVMLLLCNRDQCVCEFNWILENTQTQISNHLKILKDAGLIESYYRSNHKIYRIKDDSNRFLITYLHQQWKKNIRR